MVGLCAERSVELVVGLLAVLKAGGAYVPLEPEHPAGRLAGMVADAGLGVVLAQRALAPRLALPAGTHCVLLDREGFGSEELGESASAPRPNSACIHTKRFTTPRCAFITPLGRPVEPEV